MRYRKANRGFTRFKKLVWLAVPAIAVGGLFYPPLGLGVLVIMLMLIGMSFFRGKYFCGNLCPHGSMFDVVLMRFSVMLKIPPVFRSAALRWGFFAFFMIMFGVRLGLSLSALGDRSLLEGLGEVFVRQYLIFPTLVGLILAVFLNPRTWCSVCPMGTMQEITYRLGKRLREPKTTDIRLTWADPSRCTKCGVCSRVCPMQLEPYRALEEGGGAEFHEACIRCSTCVEHCPRQALAMSPASSAATTDRSEPVGEARFDVTLPSEGPPDAGR